jgi:hypothetical protein
VLRRPPAGFARFRANDVFVLAPVSDLGGRSYSGEFGGGAQSRPAVDPEPSAHVLDAFVCLAHGYAEPDCYFGERHRLDGKVIDAPVQLAECLGGAPFLHDA